MKVLNGEAGESVWLEITEKPNEETGSTVLTVAALLTVTFLFLLLSNSVSPDKRK